MISFDDLNEIEKVIYEVCYGKNCNYNQIVAELSKKKINVSYSYINQTCRTMACKGVLKEVRNKRQITFKSVELEKNENLEVIE